MFCRRVAAACFGLGLSFTLLIVAGRSLVIPTVMGGASIPPAQFTLLESTETSPWKPPRVAKSTAISPTVHLPLLMLGLTQSPVQRLLWLPLDEPGAVTLFADKSGAENNGVCFDLGCPQSGLYGKSGNFVHFDGVDDRIEVEDTTEFDALDEESFSISAWIYLTSHTCGFCRLINKFDGNRGFSLDLADNAGNTRLTLFLRDEDDDLIIRSSQNLLLNEWHHVAAVVSRSTQTVHLYVDGAEVDYERSDSLDGLGNLGNDAQLHIGKLTNEGNGFKGLMYDVSIYQGALTAADVQTAFQSDDPETDDWFARWYSGQVLTVFQAFDLQVEQPVAATEQDLGAIPVRAVEAVRFSLPSVCDGCRGWVFTFANREDLATVRTYFESTQRMETESPYVYEDHNALIVLDAAVPVSATTQYKDALSLGLTRTQLDAPTNQTQADYASWDKYYPTDRGQQRDPQSGRSQRTFDRWDGDNQWLYGQATWLYQDPNGGDDPPLALPTTYQGQTLDYYYHFHCEKEKNQDIYKDCLNWQIYIELFGMGDDDTELPVWARGGWSRHTPAPPIWEVYYHPNAFGGECTTESVLANGSDALLMDSATKSPFLFRMPDRVGAWHTTDEVCTVTFDSYLYQLTDVQKATRWYAITYLHDRTYDTTLKRHQIRAENVYYEYLTTVNGEDIFKEWASEIYWVWEMKPEQPLLYGMDSFWWWAWPTPPEENRDTNGDPTWADLQWCRLDLTQGPEGLGTLICEPLATSD